MRFTRRWAKASFALFPLIIFGLVMILNNMAQRYAIEPADVDLFTGPGFSLMTMIAIAGFLTLFYLSLKHRRKVPKRRDANTAPA